MLFRSEHLLVGKLSLKVLLSTKLLNAEQGLQVLTASRETCLLVGQLGLQPCLLLLVKLLLCLLVSVRYHAMQSES